MNESIQIVGELNNKVKMPSMNLGRGIQRIYKTKARKFFETMKIGQSFTVENRTVEAVKRWEVKTFAFVGGTVIIQCQLSGLVQI